ncbi:hypothetical protein BvCmsKSP015_03655 [Escherichia coli]|nr:hypothetical protein BvCmsKSP015_03655 [Escherichia coli]
MGRVVFTALTPVMWKIMGGRNIQQVTQGKRIIQRKCYTSEITSCAAGTGIIKRKPQSPVFILPAGNKNVTFPWLLTGHNFHISLHTRQSLHILQPLLNVP